ncbi:antibiotic biosynthesis monooxygenase [Agromyces albus]|uniref:antibiotic biosynthesis monooxygenase n=1 Tax=Agromyces albus TaxID=205332 RepID=UPI002789215A|nr:antibiotic biosynthesis monooxygenase [Agromyces albus]MDQ0576764.1 antibiotic biosynthesis monooxygenase (ABM) superfamily enzyme [Agromyces albus]
MPANLIIHRRVADADHPAYAEWEKRVGDALSSWPGYLDRWVLPPTPPGQVDWITAQRFSTVDAARGWLHSAERGALLRDADPMFVGNDNVQLYTGDHEERSELVSAVIATRLPAEREHDFLEWQSEVMEAESRFEGFRGHRLQAPAPGLSDDWVMHLSFDTDEHLSAWLQSDERQELLAKGSAFNENMSLTRSAVGFGFWAPGPGADDPVFKNNLLVLLMLYPLVYLWGYFVSAPLIDSHGVPIWLSLFIGNLVSTQLLGWFLVPWVFARFSWWLDGGASRGARVLGYGAVVTLYVVSMALYAWLLAIRG